MGNNVLTYGTFDLLHVGHIKLLERAKNLGNKLYVGLSTDDFAKSKGKTVQQPFELRKMVLENLGYIELVFHEASWEQKKADVESFAIETLVMGDDWKGKFDDLPCEVIYLPRTEGISSTELRRLLK